MTKQNKQELKEILAKHKLWLDNENGGVRADLSRANLAGANLSGANLYRADLSRANLSRSNLSRSNLYRANLTGADLSRANLAGANLSGANLYRANLAGVKGNNRNINTIHCGTYDIAYTDAVLQIGCEHHAIEEWWQFSDAEIRAMDEHTALKWWKIWKPIIKEIIKVSPATSTGYEEIATGG